MTPREEVEAEILKYSACTCYPALCPCVPTDAELRALIELGVRLGLAAAYEEPLVRDCSACCAAIRALTPAAVMEGGTHCFKCKAPVEAKWVREGKLEHLVGACDACGVRSVFAGRSDDDR